MLHIEPIPVWVDDFELVFHRHRVSNAQTNPPDEVEQFGFGFESSTAILRAHRTELNSNANSPQLAKANCQCWGPKEEVIKSTPFLQDIFILI